MLLVAIHVVHVAVAVTTTQRRLQHVQVIVVVLLVGTVLLLPQADLLALEDQVRVVVGGPVQDHLHVDGDSHLGISGARALEGDAPGLRLHWHIPDPGYVQLGPWQHLRVRGGDVDAVGQRVLHQGLPREGHIADVGRHRHGEVQGIVVDGSLTHVVQLGRDA